MKKFYLLFVGLLLSVTATQANEKSYQFDGSENGLTNRYRYAQPIQFVERGVEFFVFPNGEFDFNTHPIAYNRTRRGTVNVTYGAPRVQIRTNANIGVRIEHDLNGRVRRIGNTFINYDRIGRVKRIGSVYMRYHKNRHGLLRQIGGMRLKYNRWGRLVRQFGTVKPQRVNIGGNIHIDDYYDDGHDLPVHDDDLYYYKKNNKKIKKSQKRK